MKKLISIILLIVMTITLAGCTLPDRPVDEPEVEPIYVTTCIASENFTFYEASVDAIIGTKDAYMMVTPDGDVEIPTTIYEQAMEFQWEALCYRTADGVLDKYVSARKATYIPEPIIEYVDKIEYVDVPGETVYTHSIIDENFVAEGTFYYYINEDIVNLVFKEGNEMFIMTILYDNNIVNADKRATYSMIYYNSVFINVEIFGENWLDAKITELDDTVVEFNSITELVDYLALHYSFNEIKTDYIAFTDEDPNTIGGNLWMEELEAQEGGE